MKRVIQLILISIVIISVYIFNNIYFSDDKNPVVDLDASSDQLSQQTENNLIKNLKYEVKLDKNNWYIITSGLSELTYIDNVELVEMREVIAKFIDKNNF